MSRSENQVASTDMQTSGADQAIDISSCVVNYGEQSIGPVDLSVGWGEAVALIGPSGSGKTSILRVLRGEMVPSHGWARLSGIELSRIRLTQRSEFLRHSVSCLDQRPVLLPELDVVENVALPLLLNRVAERDALEQARVALFETGIDALVSRDLSTLSGGQLQRVALARALVKPSGLLLADEPTASLDRKNADRVAKLLIGQVCSNPCRALLLATHDLKIAQMCDRVVDLGELAPSI